MRQILTLTTKVVYFYKNPFLVVLNHHLDFRKDSKLIYIQGDVKNPSKIFTTSDSSAEHSSALTYGLIRNQR